MANDESLIFRIQHGSEVAEYTDWDIARRDALDKLQQQWAAAHGPALTDTETKRRTITCEKIVWASMHGDYHGLENVPMTIAAVPADLVSADRLTTAQDTTHEAQARLNGITILNAAITASEAPLTHQEAA